MYVQIRLYASHDYDLLVYTSIPYMKLDDIIYACVCAHVRKQAFSIPIPSGLNFNIEKKDKRLCVTFDDKKDADVVSWLKKIKYGYMNSAIKIITRSYLSADLLDDIFLYDSNSTRPEILNVKPIIPQKERNCEPTAADSAKKSVISENEPASGNSDIFDIFDNMMM